jgi:hypothetical protein
LGKRRGRKRLGQTRDHQHREPRRDSDKAPANDATPSASKGPAPNVAERNTSGAAQSDQIADDGSKSGGNSITDAAIINLTRWLVRWTFALVFVGAIAAVVSYFQWRALHSTDAATHSAADAAKKSAEIAEQALRMSERPIINVGNWEYSNIGINLAPLLKFRIGNNGRSAGYVFDHTAVIYTGTKLPEQPDYYGDRPHNAVVPGGGGSVGVTLDNPTPPPLTEDQFNRITKGEEAIYVYGKLSYRDTFDEIHDLGYAVRIEIIQNTSPPVFRDTVPRDGASFIYLTKRTEKKK